MGFDNSRVTFDPLNNFSSLVMQEGRVQVDADWNEWTELWSRRVRVETLDTLGPAAVPSTTPNGFLISTTTDSFGNLTDLPIGRGRIYVDGLLAENHGLAPLSSKWVPVQAGGTDPAAPANAAWDPALAELFGKDPFYSYLNQPYFPNSGTVSPLSNISGTTLAYLDVWQREVGYLQQPDLVDKALGVETTGRMQTVWQVKIGGNFTDPATACATDPRSLQSFQSASRLTTDFVELPQPAAGDCPSPPAAVATGLENQLYRVEIHQTGVTGDPHIVATFKWSRDNGSVATAVTQISSSTGSATSFDTLLVQSLGRDRALVFSPGDWIEITDDSLELIGQSGQMVQVLTTDAAFPVTTLTLNPQTTTTLALNPNFHPRIRRWDQKGKVLQSDGQTVFFDLDNLTPGPLAPGSIPVPPPGTSLILENGVTVAFDLDPSIPVGTGAFIAFDYWSFATRNADGTVEKLAQAPPLGIQHHYAPLSAITVLAGDGSSTVTVQDCRSPWPPTGSNACCCSIQVKPSDAPNLQNMVDQLDHSFPTEVCFEPGVYPLTTPLRLSSAHQGTTFQGCAGTVLAVAAGSESNFVDGMVVITGPGDVPDSPPLNLSFQQIEFSMPSVNFTAHQPALLFAGLSQANLPTDINNIVFDPDIPLLVSIGIRVVNGAGLTVEKCLFTAPPNPQNITNGFWVGVFAQGVCDGFRLEESSFEGLGSLAGSSHGYSAGFLHVPAVTFNIPTSGQSFAQAGGTVLPSSLDQALFRDNHFAVETAGGSSLSFPQLTLASSVLGVVGELKLVGNEVGISTAGFWVMPVEQAAPLQWDLTVLQGSVVAMGYPLPTGSNGAVPTSLPNSPEDPTAGQLQNFFLDLTGLAPTVFPSGVSQTLLFSLLAAANEVSTQVLPCLLAAGIPQNNAPDRILVNGNHFQMASIELPAPGINENFTAQLVNAAMSFTSVTSAAVSSNQIFNSGASREGTAAWSLYFDGTPFFAITGNVLKGTASSIDNTTWTGFNTRI